MTEQVTAETDPNEIFLSVRELDDKTLELVAEFEHHLQDSEGFMSALGGLYFGKTDSGERADPNNGTVIFWELDDEGRETVQWAINHRFTGLVENRQSLMVRKARYDTDRQVVIEVNRVDLIRKMYPSSIGPFSSLKYTGYNNTEIPQEIKPNSVLAVTKAQELLEQVRQLSENS